MGIVPNELKESEKVHFAEVKYSYAELTKFREIVWGKFGSSEGVMEELDATLVLYGLGIDIEKNKISLEVDYDFDVSLIAECIPSDSFICEFYEGCPNTGFANIIINNGDQLYNSTFPGSCSVGLPISFDYGSQRVAGWLTCAHSNGAGDTMKYKNLNIVGTLYNSVIDNSYDASILRRDGSQNNYMCDSYIMGNVIYYQESTSSSPPPQYSEVIFQGFVTDWHFDEILETNYNSVYKIVDRSTGKDIFVSLTNLVKVKTTSTNTKKSYMNNGLYWFGDGPTQKGDSGGPVMYNYNTAVGIITGGADNGTYMF
jgi:hypothetical protein